MKRNYVSMSSANLLQWCNLGRKFSSTWHLRRWFNTVTDRSQQARGCSFVIFISPPSLREAQARSACFDYVLFLSHLNDFYQTNYLNTYWTDLHEICRIGRTLAVDERSEFNFFDLSMDVAMATNFVGIPHLLVRMVFARAAPPADDNCYAGRRQTNYLTRWTQVNQLSNKLTIT